MGQERAGYGKSIVPNEVPRSGKIAVIDSPRKREEYWSQASVGKEFFFPFFSSFNALECSSLILSQRFDFLRIARYEKKNDSETRVKAIKKKKIKISFLSQF